MNTQRNPNVFLCKFLRACLLILVLSLLLTACRPEGMDLPFTTVEQEEMSSGSGEVYEAKEPGIIVITKPEDISALDSWVNSDSLGFLGELDYNQAFALAVFQGWKPSGGYAVEITRISRYRNTVNIFARFTEPDPEKEKPAVETSPYHLVAIKKNGEWNANILFQIMSDKTEIASINKFVP